jgi:hypothetical protein
LGSKDRACPLVGYLFGRLRQKLTVSALSFSFHFDAHFDFCGSLNNRRNAPKLGKKWQIYIFAEGGVAEKILFFVRFCTKTPSYTFILIKRQIFCDRPLVTDLQ